MGTWPGGILRHPSPDLAARAVEVTDWRDVPRVEAELRLALRASAEAGRAGFALSAPQIGIPLRVFVVEAWPGAFVNPVLLDHGDRQEVGDESCLSLPWGQLHRVRRWRDCRSRSSGSDGVSRVRKHRGFDARIFQHELDHLDGVLITDRTLELQPPGGVS